MLNVKKAIDYNKDRGYPQKAIGVMQLVVNARTSGEWDEQSVRAVYNWQVSKNGQIDCDGMVGPQTIGYFIGELREVYRDAEAEVLKQCEYATTSGGGSPGPLNPVAEFTQFTIRNVAFRRLRIEDSKTNKPDDCWGFDGTFGVTVKLNPKLTDAQREKYEYRQYIRGDAWIQPGDWNATRTVWTPRSSQTIPINTAFAIPGSGKETRDGLWPTEKEDACRRPGKALIRIGRRNDGPQLETFMASAWTPDANGPVFTLKDTFGYYEKFDGTPKFVGTAFKVFIEVWFRGTVVEVEWDDNASDTKEVKVVQTKTWHYRFTDTNKPWVKYT